MPNSLSTGVRVPVALLTLCLSLGPTATAPAGSPEGPPDTVIVGVTDSTAVKTPFVLHQDPSAAGGRSVYLPEGAGTKKLEGTASFPFEIRKSGVYHAWIHSYWRDSCGNSITLLIDDRPGFMAGQDRIYRTWHWVRAGRHKLDQGAHTVTLGEREDGVAVDQILFTPNEGFLPSGTLGGRGKELRRFHDDFARSPGQGMEAWDLASGTWEIVFSFDPNQIPNQYSLHGRPDGGEAIAFLKSLPWGDCRVSFSLFPIEKGTYGAVFGDPDKEKERLSAGLSMENDSPLRLGQWHRVSVEKQTRRLRIEVDGKQVLDKRSGRAAGRVGLFVASGAAAFDDLEISQIATGAEPVPVFPIGPYHFTKTRIEHPSEYLDFTDEEYREMRQSPDAQKLRRSRRFVPVVGRSHDMSPWTIRGGTWKIQNGVLTGAGPDARLLHAQEIASDTLTMTLRVRLDQPGSVVAIEPQSVPDTGPTVRVFNGDAPPGADGTIDLEPMKDTDWHAVHLRLGPDGVTARMDDGKPKKLAAADGRGQTAVIRVTAGAASFDDIEFTVPRCTDRSFLYVFDRRETDWWRVGGAWVDHGGIACILTSSWISLVAPEGRGYLWNKRDFQPDIMVAFNIMENSEWFGRQANPDHVHHPPDNVCVALSYGEDPDKGYRLEVNSQGRKKTVLYRDGEPVAEVLQDRSFPIRYVGGHAPYSPRRSRITLARRGGKLTAIVNGKVVLTYDDPNPLDAKKVGVGGYNTRLNLGHVEVRTLPRTP